MIVAGFFRLSKATSLGEQPCDTSYTRGRVWANTYLKLKSFIKDNH